jgi:hypothetical protein
VAYLNPLAALHEVETGTEVHSTGETRVIERRDLQIPLPLRSYETHDPS